MQDDTFVQAQFRTEFSYAERTLSVRTDVPLDPTGQAPD